MVKQAPKPTPSRTTARLRPARQSGVVAILAMLFLVIFSALATAMALVSQANLRSADTYQHVNRSAAAAETGMQWSAFRVAQVASMITTTKGEIDATIADAIWPVLRDQIMNTLGADLHQLEPATLVDEKITLGRIHVGSEDGAPTFRITIARHPLAGENYGSAYYQRAPYNIGGGANEFTADGQAVSAANPVIGVWVRMTSTGADGAYSRVLQSDFRIDKKVRYAILSRNRVMIGRNVLIKGSIGSKFMDVDQTHGHPVQLRDNFRGLDSTLDTWLDTLETYLAGNDQNGDNRVRLADVAESGNLANAETYDRNADGYIDAYDFFLIKYDGDEDGTLTSAEFTDNGTMVDTQLWRLINEMKYPAGTQFDWAQLRVKPPGGDWADATADFAAVDNFDNYAKISGQVILAAAKADWESGAAAGAYQKFFADSIVSESGQSPLTFQAGDDQLSNIAADSFDVSSYRDMATGDFAQQVAAAAPNEGGQPVVFTPPGAGTIEAVPYQSPHPYDYYARPVYENYTFTNVKIPKGTNALFVNCKFIGVTFIESETDNADPNFNYAGTLNPDGTLKYNVAASVNGNQVTDTKALSNNIRFEGCTFEGMVASDSPAAYTHVRNKVQFTGNTQFNLDSPNLSADQKATFIKSTIMTPQYSVDMGSFDNAADPNQFVQLDGTIVAGVFDIRGQAVIDGSIVTTFEPVAGQGPLANGGATPNFNTTIGYFESAAGDNESELPAGGFGKIIIRYDPSRALPDGINGPIEVRAEMSTYFEGH
jgi:hypothetical protein